MTVVALRRGDDFRRRVRWKDTTGAPVDLSGGYVLSASISWSSGSLALLIDQMALATGEYDISLQEAQTAQIPEGRASTLMLRYVSPSGGTVTTYAYVEALGAQTVTPGVSPIDVIVSDQGTIEVIAIGVPGPPGTGGGGGSGSTNLAIANRTATALDVTSDTGTDATLPAASTTQAGLMTAADKTKLDTAPADIAAAIAGRAPLSHGHAIGDVSGLQSALDGKQSTLGFTPENAANKGQANGYASLDGTGRVPAGQLPGFVDDVLEFPNFAGLPATGVAGVLYVTLNDNRTWRWGGSNYVEISPSPGSTDSVPEGATNLYFTTARAAAVPHAAATTSAAGFMSATDKSKLDGIAAGATANATDAALRDRSTHTGTQPASTISDFAEAVDDEVASLLVAGSGISLTYNDAANTLTIAATGGGGGSTTHFLPYSF